MQPYIHSDHEVKDSKYRPKLLQLFSQRPIASVDVFLKVLYQFFVLFCLGLVIGRNIKY